MKAAIYDPEAKASNFLKLEELDAPKLNEPSSEKASKRDGAIIKVNGVGVCGSDLLKLDRALVKAGTVLGHEMVGEIFDIKDELSQKYKLKKGDRIVSSHHVPCGKCSYCLNGKESLCKQFKSTNFTPGAFCEYLKVTEAHLEKTVLKIPDSLSNEEASFTEPIACCLKAVKKSGLMNHKGNIKVLVMGLGSIGQILGQLIKEHLPQGYTHKVIGCDLLDSKLELAKQNGFDEVKKELGKKVPQGTVTENADYIFLASGAAVTIDIALKNIRDGGTIVVFSSVSEQEISFSNNEIYYRELSILSSYSPNLEDLKDSLKLLEEKKIKVKELITHRAKLDDLGAAISKSKAANGIKVYLDTNEKS